MKFGKFEINEFCIGAIVLCVILFLVLHYTIAEETIKEKTRQLELEKEIVLMQQNNINNNER